MRGAIVCSLLVALASPARADEGSGVWLGAHGGFVFHSGRSVVVDTVSSASTSEDVDVFTRSSFVSGVALDLGLAAGPGTIGLRLSADGATPGPYYAFGVLPRYRWHGRVFQPWVGAGLGFELEGDGGDPFISVPVAGGCGLALGGGWSLTAEVTAVMMNPWGPTRTEPTGEGQMRELEDHLNRLAIQLGVAYRLY